jgi:hypothetical protein
MSSIESKERNDITVGMFFNSGKSSSTASIVSSSFFSGFVGIISGSTATSRRAFGFLVKALNFIVTVAPFRPLKVAVLQEGVREGKFAFFDFGDDLSIFITYIEDWVEIRENRQYGHLSIGVVMRQEKASPLFNDNAHALKYTFLFILVH